MIHCDSLLQNATDVITKCPHISLQNAVEHYYKTLLQNATVITNCDSIIVFAVLQGI